MRGKKRFVKLTEDEQKTLKEGWKNGKKATFRQRCHYLLLSNQGKEILEISELYEISRQVVTGWFNRYEKEGISGLQTGKGQGRPSIIRIDNETEVKKVEELVEKSPQNLKVVVGQIEELFGRKISVKTLQRLLKKKSGVGSDLGR